MTTSSIAYQYAREVWPTPGSEAGILLSIPGRIDPEVCQGVDRLLVARN